MTILCTVTNDLSYDQRMLRICTTLAEQGHAVTLIGRALPHSIPLETRGFEQHRLHCRFRQGILFYAEFNLRLFAHLLRARYDAVCSVDLDTLPAGCLASLLRGKKRVFDAHEYFTEVPEVTDRPVVKFCWKLIARLCLPFYRQAYTVGPALAGIFSKKYGITFGVVRNTPVRSVEPVAPIPENGPRILLYQGALNEARGIEATMQAMTQLEDVELWLAGEGDLSDTLRRQARASGIEHKVRFLGYVKPDELKAVTRQAWLGINVLENKGLSYYYSLANKFFDYVQAGVPVLTMNFPEYAALNTDFEVAVLLNELTPGAVVQAVRHLQQQPEAYEQLRAQCLQARAIWHWQTDAQALLKCWEGV